MSEAPGTTAPIAEMVRRIAEGFAPEKIILFGSHARGDATEDSDVDLLVLFREVEEPHQRAAEMYSALPAQGHRGVNHRAVRAVPERRQHGVLASRTRGQNRL